MTGANWVRTTGELPVGNPPVQLFNNWSRMDWLIRYWRCSLFNVLAFGGSKVDTVFDKLPGGSGFGNS